MTRIISCIIIALGVLAARPAAAGIEGNPDVPSGAVAAIDAGYEFNLDDDLMMSGYRLGVLLPIERRTTVSVQLKWNELTLRDYSQDPLWKYRGRAVTAEIGFKFYIGGE